MKLYVSTGNSRMDKKFNGSEMEYADFVNRLSKTTRTAETVEQYRKLPKAKQDDIKDVGGFILGKLKGGSRKKDCVLSRGALTLDMDHGTESIVDEIEMFHDMEMVIYSTHKHTPDSPRLRLIIPLTREVTPDEYGAVSRMIASDIGIELFDDTTYEPSRLMYWPSTSSDGVYVFKQITGNVVNPDEVLARYKNWKDVSSWPVSNRQGEVVKREIKDENGKFVPEPSEARWVKKIFRMAADGYTPAAIRRYMNDNHVKTVDGALWCDSTVFRILENEIYKGDYIMHKHYVNENRKLVPNRGEEDAWYIENDHEPIVSRKLWQDAQDKLNEKREYLSEGSFIADFTEENYPYMGHLFCGKCGYPLYHRIYSNGNRLSWDCSGVKRYGRGFCDGVNVPDGTVREQEITENTYVMEKTGETGRREYTFLKEASWKRRHRKKEFKHDVPELNLENYPFYKSIYCGECGGRLVRYVGKGGRVVWICSNQKRKGSRFCTGIRVPDAEMRKMELREEKNYITERKMKNGKKCYGHSCEKQKRDTQGENSSQENQGCSLLPCINGQ